jgi:hypothetical protein
MPRINVEIEDDVIITVAEFFEEMDDEDIEEMKGLIGAEKKAAHDEDFDKAAEKLIGNSWRLTREDEETIKRIANKIVC